jgi:hypothetical protein
MALRDRNGDSIAAVRFKLSPGGGTTEQAAFARVLPIIRDLQTRVVSLQDLVE